ncbi:UNVERIFIED_CONTAM: hypothetical protein Sangu_0998600 [Sesamum angustifolium]|uniref:Reverse transcriptase Ty1/copia-type domain-containing protein n=1 Tax=Sesamum angustifolium TaxID=2727405 RepID=A0AAW2PGR6_9LAMI
MFALQEPKHYAEAKGHAEWEKAMGEELSALIKNNIWSISELPPDKKTVGCRWAYKVKLQPDGTMERYKPSLVAKGYNKIEGVDYTDSFSPVAKSIIVQLVIVVAASLGWFVHQLDINNAFLHDYLKEDIYVVPPEGYNVPHGKFSVSDNLKTITIFSLKIQIRYICDLVLGTGLEHVKFVTTSFPPGIKLTVDGDALLPNPETYRRLVGRLLYLNLTRPDVSYDTQQLSQFVQHPCKHHMDVALYKVRYLKGCLDKGLFFPSQTSLTLSAY